MGKFRFIVLGLLTVSGVPANAADITVFTARAGATVLQEIGSEFERATGNHLTVVSGFGPAFVARINKGDAFDVVIAGAPVIDGLITSGKLRAASRVNLLRSGMGVEVRAGARKPDIFSVDEFKRVLGAAKSVGYIKLNRVDDLIERLGMTDELKSKIRVPDADIVSELVAKGEIELGIVATTQILTTKGVALVGPLPPEIQYYIQFAAGIGQDSRAPVAASDLLRFFASPTAKPVILALGMEPG